MSNPEVPLSGPAGAPTADPTQSTSSRPVFLGPPPGAVSTQGMAELADAAREAGAADDVVGASLRVACAWGPRLPFPGHGETTGLWSALATLGAADLTVARAVEPHLDALAILAEAPQPGPDTPEDATWGVYAAEAPGRRLVAADGPDGWVLTGHKPWCSLAQSVTHALVTAWVDEGTRGLFAVDLRADRVRPDMSPGSWVSHGLPQVTSGGVDFDGAAATPVGEPGWYLDRPGFAWGGIGVAAVWYGATVAVARRVVQHVTRRTPDQLAELHLGQLDLALASARDALEAAAVVVDGPQGEGLPAALVALRARSLTAAAVDTVVQVADHAMGPAPLAHDADHAQRVSDLRLYVRQHHAERDVAALGHQLLATTRQGSPW